MLKPFPWQAGQWQQLQAARSQARLPHALLLTGADGMGLEQFACALAATLLCRENASRHTACGSCKSCVLFQAGNHPDLLSIQPEEKARQIKVEAIRQLIDYVYMKSQYGKYKISIISPADAMNRSAANSLLKTLEEPPALSLLILVSTRAQLLPVTLRSRCQRLDFPPVADAQSVQWLQTRLKDTNINADELLSMAQGAPLTALELLESDGLQQQQLLLQDLLDLRRGRCDPVVTAKNWQAQDTTAVFRELLGFFLTMCRLKLGMPANNSTVHRDLQRLIKGLDLLQLIRCYDVLLQHFHAVRGPISLNKQGLLEDFIVTWQSMTNNHREAG